MDSIYLNVVERINTDYAELLHHLREMDTRTAYLQMFEQSLSPAMSKPLWTSEIWIQQQAIMPMPSDEWTIMSFQKFRSWITAYELIMRDEGLIGHKEPAMLVDGDDDARLVQRR